MPLKESGYLEDGWKYSVHKKCMVKSTKKAICVKKVMGLNNFFLINCSFL